MGEKAYDIDQLTFLNLDEVSEKMKYDIFELFEDEQSLGHVHKDDLKSYIDKNPSFVSDKISICAYASDSLQPIYKHPYFQRRMPQVLEQTASQMDDNKNEPHYILTNGKKTGPFDHDEIQKMLESSELLFTDLICIGKEGSWRKIYQDNSLDRRNLEQTKEHLPQLPSRETFEDSKYEVYQSFENVSDDNLKKEAVAGLAYMGRVITGKVSQNEKLFTIKTKNIEDILKEDNKEIIPLHVKLVQYLNKYKSVIQGIIIGVSAFLLIGFAVTQIKSYFKQRANQVKVKKNAQISNRVDTNLKIPSKSNLSIDSGTTNKRNNIVKDSRKPASNSRKLQRTKNSLSESETFRDRLGEQDDIYDDSYDDGEENFENDPVRSKVSKETYDPYLELIKEEKIIEQNNLEAFIDDAEQGEPLSGDIEEEIFDEEVEF